MSNMTIKMRLIATLAFLSVIAIAVGITGLSATSAVRQGLNNLYGEELEPANLLADIRVLIRSNAIALDDALLDPSAEKLDATQTTFNNNKRKIDEDWKKMNEVDLSA